MRIEPVHFWRWIESGLEWNVRICVVACLQFRPISATTQMLRVNVRGFSKDTPTSCSYHVIIRGHAHSSLCQSTLQIYSADAIKSGLKPVPAMRIQSRSNPIAVRTGLLTLVQQHMLSGVGNLTDTVAKFLTDECHVHVDDVRVGDA